MPITALPSPPSRSDPANFAERGDTFMAALPAFATEANALQDDVNAKQEVASTAATTATGAASTATTKASEASASAASANQYKLDAQTAKGQAESARDAAAASAASIELPLPISSGGHGGDTADHGLTNLGGTAVGKGVFTAADEAAGRAALGLSETIVKTYDSGEITVTAADGATLPHGLGSYPKIVQVFLKCVTADIGYSPGEYVLVPSDAQFDGTNSRGAQLFFPNADSISYVFGDNVNTFVLINKATRSVGSIVNSNWKLVIRAYA